MEKLISGALAIVLVFSMFGCAATSQNSQSSVQTVKTNSSAAPVSSEPDSYTFTLPASFFQGQDIDKATAEAKAEGVTVTKNSDGSVTYKMNKETHKKMMDELDKGLQEAFADIKSGKDYKSIKDVKHNDNYSEITLVVDQAAYEKSMDGFAILGLYIVAASYNVFNGVQINDIKVTFTLQNEKTKKTFKTIVYPDDLNKAVSAASSK